jgi:response regulator of citrate/malate metabolism
MDEHSLLSELAAAFTLPELEPGDVTALTMCEACNISENRARRILERKVKAGELVAYFARGENGHTITAYRKRTPAE